MDQRQKAKKAYLWREAGKKHAGKIWAGGFTGWEDHQKRLGSIFSIVAEEFLGSFIGVAGPLIDDIVEANVETAILDYLDDCYLGVEQVMRHKDPNGHYWHLGKPGNFVLKSHGFDSKKFGYQFNLSDVIAEDIFLMLETSDQKYEAEALAMADYFERLASKIRLSAKQGCKEGERWADEV